MATRAQVNSLVGNVTRRMFMAYGQDNLEIVKLFVRVMVSEAKRIGTPQARRRMMATLREVYIDIYGVDPLGKREFKKWIQTALNPWQGDQFRPADPINNVSPNDAFDAEDEVIT